MKVCKIALLAIGLALLLIIAIPVTVSATIGGSDAPAGLKEFYAFLVNLAQQGLDAYVVFLKAL